MSVYIIVIIIVFMICNILLVSVNRKTKMHSIKIDKAYLSLFLLSFSFYFNWVFKLKSRSVIFLISYGPKFCFFNRKLGDFLLSPETPDKNRKDNRTTLIVRARISLMYLCRSLRRRDARCRHNNTLYIINKKFMTENCPWERVAKKRDREKEVLSIHKEIIYEYMKSTKKKRRKKWKRYIVTRRRWIIGIRSVILRH